MSMFDLVLPKTLHSLKKKRVVFFGFIGRFWDWSQFLKDPPPQPQFHCPRTQASLKSCNCCSLPLGTSCYAANGPSAALATVKVSKYWSVVPVGGRVKVKYKGISSQCCTEPVFQLWPLCKSLQSSWNTRYDLRLLNDLWLNWGVLLLVIRSWRFQKVRFFFYLYCAFEMIQSFP